MVAYSFQKMFAPQVEGLTKLHTVRAHRKRHARPGEAVQLYAGMRTKYCRKLVTPDPICTHLDDIRLEIAPEMRIEGIEINGRELSDAEIEAFAIADGFSPARLTTPESGWQWKRDTTARALMGWFWEGAPLGPWQGVIIHWKPEAE
jgi:hypothetical protein